MRKFLILFIFSILLNSHPSSANPGLLPIISEVYLDDNDNWTIELCNKTNTYIKDLNRLRIITSTDTSTIKTGIEFKNNCILLTKDNLDKPIKLLRSGDYIIFQYKHDSTHWYGFYTHMFLWGKINNKNQEISYTNHVLNFPNIAPRKGQSLCTVVCNYFQNPYAAQASIEIVLSSIHYQEKKESYYLFYKTV